MKEAICILIFCGLTQTISAASKEDINIIRRLALSTSSKFPQPYIFKKWPTYSYKPYYRPRPSYTIPILVDKPYKPQPVKKPARPNKTKPNYSYQHISRPIDYYPRPQKPTSSNYPNNSNKPDALYYQTNQIYNIQKPKPSKPTKPNENRPQKPLDYNPEETDNPSYQIYKPNHKPSKPTKPIKNRPQKPLNYNPEDIEIDYQIYIPKPEPSHPSKPNAYRPLNFPNYPNIPNKPDDLSKPSYSLYKPKPTSSPPKPIYTVTQQYTSNYLDSDGPQSYQSYQSNRPKPEDPYPSQFLQEPSNTYEDEYPSQFYDSQQDVPVQSTYLSQYLQNDIDKNWQGEEESYYDSMIFYPYEQNYERRRPNGYDEIDDYPDMNEEFDDTEYNPQQERSLRLKPNNIFQHLATDKRGILVPYKTFEYNPSAYKFLKNMWKSKFYHPYKWWSNLIPKHIYNLQNKRRKPVKPYSRPFGYLNSDFPYTWGNLPLLSTRPASVHRIRNSLMESDPSMEDDYSDEVFENYLRRPSEQIDGYFGRSPLEEKSTYFETRRNENRGN